jgi:hypothetical protein
MTFKIEENRVRPSNIPSAGNVGPVGLNLLCDEVFLVQMPDLRAQTLLPVIQQKA